MGPILTARSPLVKVGYFQRKSRHKNGEVCLPIGNGARLGSHLVHLPVWHRTEAGAAISPDLYRQRAVSTVLQELFRYVKPKFLNTNKTYPSTLC